MSRKPPRKPAAGSAPRREVPKAGPTLAEVQAVLALMEVAGQLPAAVRSQWALLMQLLPWYATQHGDPWGQPAREVVQRLVQAVRVLITPQVFDGVAAVLPDIADALSEPLVR